MVYLKVLYSLIIIEPRWRSCEVPHDVGSRWLLVGEGLRSTQTGLVPIQQVSYCWAGWTVFPFMVDGELRCYTVCSFVTSANAMFKDTIM